MLLPTGVNENGSIMAAGTGVCIELGILLIVSLIPIKAQEELKKCCQSKKTVTRNKQTTQLSMQERHTANYVHSFMMVQISVLNSS